MTTRCDGCQQVIAITHTRVEKGTFKVQMLCHECAEEYKQHLIGMGYILKPGYPAHAGPMSA